MTPNLSAMSAVRLNASGSGRLGSWAPEVVRLHAGVEDLLVLVVRRGGRRVEATI
jgi:hypothetical protein